MLIQSWDMIKFFFEKADILLSNLLCMKVTLILWKIQVKLLRIIFKCKVSTWLIEKNKKF